MPEAVIKLEDVSKVYGKESIALRDVDLKVDRGDFVSIVGRSGTGKTTLVKLMIGEEKPTVGKIWVNGWEVEKIKRNKVPFLRREIGVVFQDFKLILKKTVYENVAFALMVSDATNKRIEKIVPKVISMVGLGGKEERFPEELSGGEQQRVAIARALVHEPDILIADELTGDLDAIYAWEIMEILLNINKLGTTVLVATHDRDIVNRANKRVVTLVEGEIVRDQREGKYLV